MKLQAVPVPRDPHKLFLEPLKAYIDERPDSTLVEVILTVELTRYLRRCENSGIRIKNKKPTRRETNLRPIAKRHK